MTKDVEEAVARAIFNAGENTWPDPDGPTPWGCAGPSDRYCATVLAEAAITAYQSALSTAGYVIVPREKVDEAATGFEVLAQYDGCSSGAKALAEYGYKQVIAALNERGEGAT